MAKIAKWIEDQKPVLDENLTSQELKRIYTDLTGHPVKGKKHEVIEQLLEFLSFDDSPKAFQAWFRSLPAYLQASLEKAAFRDYITVREIPQLQEVELFESHGPYVTRNTINPSLAMELFSPCTDAFIGLKRGFREIFMHWLPKPAEFPLQPAQDQSPDDVWSNEPALGETLPLLLKALDTFLLEQDDLEKVCRKGLNKSQIKSLRALCAQKPFPRGQKIGMDPINVLARFLPYFDWDTPARPEQIHDRIKQLVNNFFASCLPEQPYPRRFYKHSGMYEYDVVTSHMSRISGRQVYSNQVWFFPPSRHYFHTILMTIAETQQWQNMEEALLSLEMQNLTTSPLPESVWETLRYRAEAISIEKHHLSTSRYYAGYIYPQEIFSRVLLDKPCMKSYCYLMATLGVLEITEKEPDLPVQRQSKHLPVSPCDAINAIRVTDFGRWCLGLTQERPATRKIVFEALADKDLLLVTLKGTSLERRIFLDDIGEKLGEDRYRITPGSFIGKCTSTTDIRERITRFYDLIDPEPAPHWEAFFDDLLSRSHAFSSYTEGILFSLPDDPELRRLLSSDQKLSSLAFRAEQGRLAVPKQQVQKFLKLLRDAGYLPPF
ncbi:hypothetical protein AU468_04295 [Alkalispirochaeta sphaeroplastigenens]|uniref:Uncharacterized protein n=1 Tax=Alkalispirochaeta sphaeroplastigenens TaxID=1187066 RepID=A0A2S4JX14_9SPIO|nr:hypothetical protein [Alkalispirochaeta sphaeroplastigenens]POR04040.1 hypothetical protein AU468_04295 [Alkalispirochaeta sphaeroplastigenens]